MPQSFLYSINDVTLWNLVLDGDMKALSVLYERHYELLLNFGMKYVADEGLVKDCIQDIFVKFCTSRRLSDTRYVRSYFLTSLKHAISDRLSVMRRTETLNDSAFLLEMDAEEIMVIFNDSDEHQLLCHKLVEAFNSLPVNQREAIYLRYVRSLSHKEIAAVMNINMQSSMNLISRALGNLRVKMGLKPLLLVAFLILFYR